MHFTTWPTYVGLLLCVSCASAPPAPAPPAPQLPAGEGSADVALDGSLDSYIAHALAARPELRGLAERWRADEHRIDTIDTLPSPRVEYGYYVLRGGPERHRVMVRQDVPWPSRARAGADVFRTTLAVHEQRYDAESLEIAWQVADAYWRAWEVRKLSYWHDEHLLIVESLIDAARTRVETGRGVVADVAQVELSLSRTADMVMTAHEQFERASIELRRAAQLGRSETLTVSGEPNPPRLPSESADALIEAAAAHPNIVALRRQQDVLDRRAIAARKSVLPNLTVGAEWMEMAADPAMSHGGQDSVVATIGLTLPFFTGERRAESDAALSEREAVGADIEVAGRDAEAAVLRLLAELRETARRVRLYERTLTPQAETVLESVRGAYEVGASPIASVLLAQHELLDIRIELVRARATHERTWAMLERIVGRPIAAEVMP